MLLICPLQQTHHTGKQKENKSLMVTACFQLQAKGPFLHTIPSVAGALVHIFFIFLFPLFFPYFFFFFFSFSFFFFIFLRLSFYFFFFLFSLLFLLLFSSPPSFSSFLTQLRGPSGPPKGRAPILCIGCIGLYRPLPFDNAV